MGRYKMSVIPEPPPNTRSIMKNIGKGPTLKGDGNRYYACGQCDRTLLRRVNRDQIQGIVFWCSTCGAFNEIPRAHQTN